MCDRRGTVSHTTSPATAAARETEDGEELPELRALLRHPIVRELVCENERLLGELAQVEQRRRGGPCGAVMSDGLEAQAAASLAHDEAQSRTHIALAEAETRGELITTHILHDALLPYIHDVEEEVYALRGWCERLQSYMALHQRMAGGSGSGTTPTLTVRAQPGGGVAAATASTHSSRASSAHTNAREDDVQPLTQQQQNIRRRQPCTASAKSSRNPTPPPTPKRKRVRDDSPVRSPLMLTRRQTLNYV